MRRRDSAAGACGTSHGVRDVRDTATGLHGRSTRAGHTLLLLLLLLLALTLLLLHTRHAHGHQLLDAKQELGV